MEPKRSFKEKEQFKKDEWVIQENAAPAIVTDELWNEAQNGCKLLPLLHAPKQVHIFLEGY